MEFENACSEVDFILDNLDPNDKIKLPQNVINFFKENKSNTYTVNLDPSKELKDQVLKDETKAFLKILYMKYYSAEKVSFEEPFVDPEVQTEELVIYKEHKISNFFKNLLNIFKGR